MASSVYAAIAAFAVSLLTLPLLSRLAHMYGLVDEPGGRKRHQGNVPLIGGLAIFLAFLIVLPFAGGGGALHPALVTGMLVLVVFGALDDHRDLSSGVKLAFQILAGVLVVSWGGLAVWELGTYPGIGVLELGTWAVPFTLLVVVGFINAMNMMDGIDGLAGGIALSIFFWLGVIAVLATGAVPGPLAMIAGGVLAFLLFNVRHRWMPRARAFLGDCGSMMLGFVAAWFAIALAGLEHTPVSPVAFAWVLALPVMDTVSLMVRRLSKGRSPFTADREHLHHIFLRAGFSVQETAAFLTSVSVLLGGVGVLASLAGVPDVLLLTGLMVLGLLHVVFVRYAWRTMKALRRLHRLTHLEGGLSARVGRMRPGSLALCAPVSGWRRTLALLGLYLYVVSIPFSVAGMNIGLGLVLLATVLSVRAFLRDAVRLPLFWVALAVTAYVLLRGWVGELQAEIPASAGVPPWRHFIRVTGLMSLPLAWWLAGARFHWPWLFWVLVFGGAVAVAAQVDWIALGRGQLHDPMAWGEPPVAGFMAAVALVVMLGGFVAGMQRFGRGWRPMFVALASAAACVPLVVLLVASQYATGWLGAAVGALVVVGGAAAYGAARQRFTLVLAGMLAFLGVSAGVTILLTGQVLEREQISEPVQATLLYLGGQPELAAGHHPVTVERLQLWSTAWAQFRERPLVGWGSSLPLDTSGDVLQRASRHPGFKSLYAATAVAYGAVGLFGFALVMLLLFREFRHAVRRGVLPTPWLFAVLGVTAAMLSMFALATQIENTASRSILVMTMAIYAATAFQMRWIRDARARRRAALP
ncbi:MAG: undecaprenyl/decaprenyl-phosphate alpha-N-acetylglucosaminyl 1-phosphate transferase [Ectothiorhodospiraceae bacterium]|nr:undecaprenyl/decaprenyl-phosphate alpha-N-acetylglucosaminyl 1-phosphate transferase [Ectothiorhodospiraceae bacterium]